MAFIHHMKLRASFLALALIVMAALATAPLSAHKAHQGNMSDAEMAHMTAVETAEAPAEMHDMGPNAKSHEEGAHTTEAHVAHHAVTEMAAPLSAEDALELRIEKNRMTSSADFLGRLHPVAAHFPIALLLVAFLAELALVFRPTLGLELTIRFLVAGGAIGAVVSALLGWFAAGWRLSDRSETLGLHRWNGTAIALAGVLAWVIAARGGNRISLRIALALLAIALVVQGFLGGEMVFGPNHMGFQ